MTSIGLTEASAKLSDDRALAACPWRTQEMQQLPDASLKVLLKLLNDVERRHERPATLLEVLATMLPKVADPEL